MVGDAKSEIKGKKNIQIIQTGKIYHIVNPDFSRKRCQICGGESSRGRLNSHHIFPRRMQVEHPILKELRIYICDDCEEKIHPENVDPEKIIAKQNRTIKYYQDILRNYEQDNNHKFLQFLLERIKGFEKMIIRIPEMYKKTPRKIYPQQRLLEGHILESKHILRQYKQIMRKRAKVSNNERDNKKAM